MGVDTRSDGHEGNRPLRLWTRPFVVMCIVNFCCALSFYLIVVRIAELAMNTYGVVHSVAGLTVTVYVIAALVARLVFGSKIDQWGVKRSLVIGTVVNVVAALLYLVPMPFAALLGVRALHGFAFALMSGAAAAGIPFIIPRERFGEGIGYFSMMQALATGIGPFVAILATNAFGSYHAMFPCAVAVSIVGLAGAVILKFPSGERLEAKAAEGEVDDALAEAEADEKRGIGSLLQLSVLPIGAVMFLCYFAYSGILSFVTMYADSMGLQDAVSMYFVVYCIAILLTRPPVGRRVDRAGENSIIYWCFVSLVIGFAVLTFTVNGAMLLASAALVGFGVGATQSILQAVIARDTPADELGRANSTFLMNLDMGSGIGPVVIGAFIPLVGYSGSYFILTIVALAAGVLYYFVHGRHQEKRNVKR